MKKKDIFKLGLGVLAGTGLSACSKTNNNEESIIVDKNKETNDNKDNVSVNAADTKTLVDKTISFTNKNVADVFKYNFEKDKNKSFVYSPFSHLSCLNILNKYTDMSKENELMEYNDCNYSNLKLKNIIAANNFIVKRKDLNEKSFDEVQFAEFPKEAEEKSMNLQKEILGEVLLKPDYSDPTNEAVALNVSKFLGYWTKAYDKDATCDSDYALMDGSTIKVQKMFSGDLVKDNPMGYEDDEVQIYSKPLTDEEGKKEITASAYIIYPKNTQDIEKIGENISDYINKYENNSIKYDKVFVNIPKIEIKTKTDLGEIAKNTNKKYINDIYRFKDEFKRKDDELKISSVKQVATLKVDETKVEAKAVTEAIIECTSLNVDNKVFEMDINKPFIFVASSYADKENIVPIISFVAYINNPVEK